MLISKQFKGICRGCKREVDAYEYKGLEGSIYGSRYCKELSEFFLAHPRARKALDNLREAKGEVPCMEREPNITTPV